MAITPYSKDNPALQGVPDTPAADFVPYGYVYAMVDVRGTGSSGGSFELLGQREVRDDVELVQWASRLAGADGRVGMVGASYLALDQLFTAAAVGPGSPLKAIFPIVVGTDMYRELAIPGGIFNNLFDTPYAALFEVTLDTLGPLTAGHGPQQTGADLGQHVGGSAEIDGRTASDSFDGGDRAYDQAFWRERDVASAIARIPANGIPVLPATVARIAAGHRIRITVQSSSRPYLEPTMPDQAQLAGGTYSVERGRSSATLTVVSPGALPTSAVDWGACVTDCGAP